MKGNIVRVHLQQFMVFNDFELKPGRHVNLVIAPNGCGKSSLIAGIMLGLCGKPHNVGRGDHVGQFVKTGFSEALIEIELLNPEGNYVIQRRILRENNKSTWNLNGAHVPQKQVEELMNKLHIQVDNLCQVLPQDKVCEFSRMNPQTLLENTEKSVGSEVLLKYHIDLKEMSKAKVEVENKLKDKTARKDKEVSLNRGIQSTVDMIYEKGHFLDKIKLYKKQRAWVAYKDQYALVQEVKKSFHSAKAELKVCQEKEKQVSCGIEDLKVEVVKLTADARSKNEEKRKVERNLQKALQEADQQKEELENIEEKFQDSIKNEEMRIKELEQLKQHLSKLEYDLTNYCGLSEEQLNEQIQQITLDLTRTKQKITEVKNDEEIMKNRVENLNHQIRADHERKKRLGNHRLNFVRSYLPEVFEAFSWLEQNSHEFSHKIYGPILLEIDIKDDSYIRFVEETIPKRDLQAFVCENKEDMNKFIKLMREGRNLSINVVYSGPEHPSSSSFSSNIPLDQLKNFGFFMFVREMFTAPETIMKYLCRTAGISRIPVGSSTDIEEQFDNLPRSLNFFLSGANKYAIRVSKYSKEKYTSINSINKPRFLSSTSTNEVRKIDESIKVLSEEKVGLESQLSALQDRRATYEEQFNSMKEKKIKLADGKGKKALTERRIKDKRMQIASIDMEKINIDEERRKANVERNKVISVLCGIDEKIQSFCNKIEGTVKMCVEVDWKLKEKKENLNKRENFARGTRRVRMDQEEVVKKLELQYTQVRQEAKEIHDEALELSDGKIPDQSFHDTVHESREVLSRKIQELQAKADFMSVANQNVVAEFEKRREVIIRLSEEIEQLNEQSNDIKTRLLETREKWLPELQMVIDKINENFHKYFTKLGCAGEVTLSITDPDNYEQYGIAIKVKFRDDDQLQVLNQFTQSGGERSVATALYVIAMQDLTHVPFRCVDEINQGMDPMNERHVFQLLVNATEGDDTPQYFLLTPKLLPGLTYSSNMTITSIMNVPGRKIENWSTKKQIQLKISSEGKKKKSEHKGLGKKTKAL